MATVIKGNVLLNIPDNQLSEYVAKGFDVANVAGTVIKKAVPDDKAQLQKLYTEQQATIVRLEKELREYKEKYESLLNEKTQDKTVEDTVLEENVEEIKKPKRSNTKAKKG